MSLPINHDYEIDCTERRIIMKNLEVGTIHAMTVEKYTRVGFLLKKDLDELMLFAENATKELIVGDVIDVFIYQDKENVLRATMIIPTVTFNTFDWAEVIEVVPHYGAFVSIGLPREILVPYDALPLYKSAWPTMGDKLYVSLTRDKQERLLGVLGSEESFDDVYEFAMDVKLNDEITGRVIRVDREGTVIITDNTHHRGFIHHTEMEREPRLGELVTGRVIEVKEDGSINASLLPLKHERIDTDADIILNYLQEADGMMPFTDKSNPDDIRIIFKMSKSNFKRALGRLMKNRKITQADGKTVLVEIAEPETVIETKIDTKTETE